MSGLSPGYLASYIHAQAADMSDEILADVGMSMPKETLTDGGPVVTMTVTDGRNTLLVRISKEE